MITTVVQFPVTLTTMTQVRAAFENSVPRYQPLAGLIRKYYLLADERRIAGGVYLWHSREDAERLFTDAWKQMVEQKYGGVPTVLWFETPIVIDNKSKEVTVEPQTQGVTPDPRGRSRSG